MAKVLVDAGHEVTGLVRSEGRGAALAAAGMTPVIGALVDSDRPTSPDPPDEAR